MVRRLDEIVSMYRGKGFGELLELYHGIVEGGVKIRDPSPPRSFTEYLLDPAYSLDYWAIISIVSATLIVVYFGDVNLLIKTIRVFASTIYLLLLPGYATVKLLYNNRLNDLEELLLSLGLSIAVIVLLGLLFNTLGLGIGLETYLPFISLYIILLHLTVKYKSYIHYRRAMWNELSEG